MAKENNNFELGPHTLSIDRRLHRINRDRLIERLRNDSDLSSISNNSIVIVLLQGGKSHNNYDTDTEPVFRQESYFHWAFGVREPEFYGAINLNDGRSFLFVPKLPASYSVWMGKLYTLEDYRNRYNVDAVFYTDQVSLATCQTDINLFVLEHSNIPNFCSANGSLRLVWFLNEFPHRIPSFYFLLISKN